MDIRIRRNEYCSIGLPSCDIVFSATRTCFIAYGFKESSMEMTILRSLLKGRGIEAVEAAGNLAPGQSAFCAKICSKIIGSRFCIVLLNRDSADGHPSPNANVNMEYGLMLGFNKYVIPFQREGEPLPFNVAGLDTVKYDGQSFEAKAAKAIDQAIAETSQTPTSLPTDSNIQAFLLSKGWLVPPLRNEGDMNLFDLGSALQFNMLMTFDGMQYAYFGNFTALRTETVLWRARKLADIISARLGSIPRRVTLGMIQQDVALKLTSLLSKLPILLLVTSNSDRDLLRSELSKANTDWPIEVFSLEDVNSAIQVAS